MHTQRDSTTSVSRTLDRDGETGDAIDVARRAPVEPLVVPKLDEAIVQAKLTVGPAGDPFEREADRVADQVVRSLRSGGPDLADDGGGDDGGGDGRSDGRGDVRIGRRVMRARPTTQPGADTRTGSDPPDRIRRAPTVSPTVEHATGPRIQRNIATGDLSATSIADTPVQQIEAIDPKQIGGVAYDVLHDEMGQSWSTAKHVLAAGKLPDGTTTPEQAASLRAMMRKLWEYRQWHHEEVLKLTQVEVNHQTGDPEGLKKWIAAGSTTLTSDIDVNLKGNETELAVAVFNKLFKQFGWDFEAGVVYDVNVYAMDFMHGMGEEVDGQLKVSQEGSRKGVKEGGIDIEDVSAMDREMQKEWTLVKTRIYMTQAEWDDYKDAAGGNHGDAATFARVEARYDEYRTTLRKQMEADTGKTIAVADETEKSGYAAIQDQAKSTGATEGAAEDISMAASNRVYEQKLAQVAMYRQALKTAMAEYDNVVDNPGVAKKLGVGADELEAMKFKINSLLFELRDLLSECSLYANEAYLTHGGVNHGVVGLQAGRGIVLTKSAMFDAFQENLADALKEIARHGDTLGEAAYKAGKYIWRMADAVDNLGLDVEETRTLLTVGGQIANILKALDEQQEEQCEALVRRTLGVTTVDGLRQVVTGFGMVVNAQYNEKVREREGGGSSATSIDKGNWDK